jgi:hypothetical protein
VRPGGQSWARLEITSAGARSGRPGRTSGRGRVGSRCFWMRLYGLGGMDSVRGQRIDLGLDCSVVLCCAVRCGAVRYVRWRCCFLFPCWKGGWWL